MIYKTIRDVSKKRHIPVSKLESDLGFANGTIRKWDAAESLQLGKIKAVAKYLEIDPYTLLLIGVDLDTLEGE